MSEISILAGAAMALLIAQRKVTPWLASLAALIVEENNERGGWGAQVVADVASRAIGYIEAPIRRLATPDVPIPFSPVLEEAVIPSEAQIREAILDLVRP